MSTNTLNFHKQTLVIPANKSEAASAAFSGGARLRFIGLPTNPDGTLAIQGKHMTFKGSMTGLDGWFSVLDYQGSPIAIPLVAAQDIRHVQNGLDASDAMLPINQRELFAGIQMLIPVVDRLQKEDRKITLFFEAD